MTFDRLIWLNWEHYKIRNFWWIGPFYKGSVWVGHSFKKLSNEQRNCMNQEHESKARTNTITTNLTDDLWEPTKNIKARNFWWVEPFYKWRWLNRKGTFYNILFRAIRANCLKCWIVNHRFFSEPPLSKEIYTKLAYSHHAKFQTLLTKGTV